MNVVPILGEHALIVGQTGSGKTTSARILLEQYAGRVPILVIDSKGDGTLENMAGARVVERPSLLTFSGLEVYKPEGALNTAPALDAALLHAYNAQRAMIVYIDETYQVCPTSKPSHGLASLLMRGRHRTVDGRPVRLSVWMSAQRPAWIPRHCGTEATHFFIHRLSAADREMMASYTGQDDVTQPVHGHQLWYYRHGMRSAASFQFNIGESAA